MNLEDKLNFQITKIFIDEIDELSLFLADESEIGFSAHQWKLKIIWMWKENPFFISGKEIGWKITDDQNKIMGFLGSIPVKYVINNTKFDGYWATSWYVNSNARSCSLALFENFSNSEGILFNNTPIKRVEPILSKLFKYSKADNKWFNSSIFYLFNPLNSGYSKFNYFRNKWLNILFYLLTTVFILFREMLYLFCYFIFGMYNFDNLKRMFSEDSSELDNQMLSWIVNKSDDSNRIFLYDIYSKGNCKGSFLVKVRLSARFNYIEFIQSKSSDTSNFNNFISYFKFVKFLEKEFPHLNFAIIKSDFDFGLYSILLGFKVNFNQSCYYKNKTKSNIESFRASSIDGDSIFF
jgi:hypothetical protein